MENKEKNFISAVIYVHNAANRIERFLTTVINELETNFEHSEIIRQMITALQSLRKCQIKQNLPAFQW